MEQSCLLQQSSVRHGQWRGWASWHLKTSPPKTGRGSSVSLHDWGGRMVTWKPAASPSSLPPFSPPFPLPFFFYFLFHIFFIAFYIFAFILFIIIIIHYIPFTFIISVQTRPDSDRSLRRIPRLTPAPPRRRLWTAAPAGLCMAGAATAPDHPMTWTVER